MMMLQVFSRTAILDAFRGDAMMYGLLVLQRERVVHGGVDT